MSKSPGSLRNLFEMAFLKKSKYILFASAIALAAPLVAAQDAEEVISADEAKKIAKAYDKLVAKAQSEDVIAVIARVPLNGVTEDSAGSYKDGLKELKQFAKTIDVKVKKEITRLGLVSLTVTLAQLDSLLASGLLEVLEEDAVLEPSLQTSVPWVNADVYQAMGNIGSGKAVAIFDTGVDTSHPSFSGRIVEEACFSIVSGGTLCPNGQDTMFGLGAGDDACDIHDIGDCEHGTHVAGIAAGSDASVVGLAPGADIVSVQVFHYNTGMTRMGAAASDMLAGMDWVLNDAVSDIAAINMSIGGGVNQGACDSDIMASVVTQLRQAGIATVIAAGNNYSQTGVSWPGCISDAITVASSLNGTDTFSGFSNVSPEVDVVAPGSSIYAAIPGGGFGYKSGTSMAAPHVAGVVTALKADFTWATVTDIELALESTGVPVVQSSTGTSFPRIDVAAAAALLSGFFSAEYQAEDQTWDDAAVETEHAGFTGTGYVNTVNESGQWIEFAVNAPADAYTTVEVYYANGSSARAAAVVVNGEYKTVDPQFAGTGGWASWAAETFSVNLVEGANTIRLVATGSSGLANIDRMRLEFPQQNRAPVIVAAIADIEMEQGEPAYVIDLNTVFADPDGDTLYFDKDSSYTDSPNVRFISATELEIDPVEIGTEWFEIRAYDDGGAEVSFTFNMTVVAPNQAPVIANPIADISIVLGSDSFVIDLNSVFSDANGDVLSFSREATDDESPNLMFVSQTELQVSAIEVGTVTHYVIASDGRGGFATDSFNLTVTENPGNTAPIILVQKGDVLISDLRESHVDTLSQYFYDAEGDALTYSAVSSDENIVTVEVTGDFILFEGWWTYGTAVVSITASDGQYSVTMDVPVRLPQPNRAPVVVNPINDITMAQGAASYVIDLNTVFSDPDGDTLSFDKDSSYTDSPNVRFVSATELEIDPVELGTEWFEIRAYDGRGGEVTITFDMTVVAQNLPPIVANPIADIQMALGDSPITIDLNTVFSDPEGGALTFDHYAMDEELDDVTLFAGGILQVDADYAGSNTHTIYAFDDQGQEAVSEFDVVITLGGFSVVLQAEDQTWLNAAVETEHAGFMGTGFVNTENVAGTWVELAVDVPSAGTYTVSVRYANGSSSRPQQVYINGDLGPVVDFPGTGAWSTWVEQSFSVSFSNAGPQTLTFVSQASGGAPNLDQFTVTLQ